MSSPDSAPRHPLSFAHVGRGELRATVLAMLFFFTLLCAYYMVRPLRDAYGAERPGDLRWLFTGTFVLTVLVQPLFGALVARHGRGAIVARSYRALAASMVVLGLLLGGLEGEALRRTQTLFFCWLSVFNIVAVSIFWGLLADLFGPERARRLYGLVGVGGTLGAIFGATIASYVADALAPFGFESMHLPILTAVLLEVCVRLHRGLERSTAPLGQPGDDGEANPVHSPGSSAGKEPIGGSVWAGFRRVARSPYLLGICAYVAVYVMGSTLMYDLAANLTQDAFADTAERRSFFARVDLWTNAATLLLQVFATSFVLRRVGIGAGLAAVPLVGLVGFGVLAANPTIAALAVFQVARRGTEFGLSKPAREALFTVVPREDKYKAKLVIDAAVYRGGDAATLWLKHAVLGAGVALTTVAWSLVGVAAIGLVVAVLLGVGFRRREAAAALGAQNGLTPPG